MTTEPPLRPGDVLTVVRLPIYDHPKEAPAERRSKKVVRSAKWSKYNPEVFAVELEGMKQKYAGGAEIYRKFRLDIGRDGEVTLWDGPPKPLKYRVVEVERPGELGGNPADIHAFPEAPPRVRVGSRTYALSTFGPPMIGAIEDALGTIDMDAPEVEKGAGARVIEDPDANRWRYLWAYAEDGDDLLMWRYSDGDVKAAGTARSFPKTFEELINSRQLNHVTPEEMAELVGAMKARQVETLDSLQAWWDEIQSNEQRELTRQAQAYFDEHVRPDLDVARAQIEAGVVPIGFCPTKGDPRPHERQMMSQAFYEILGRHRFSGHEVYDSEAEQEILGQMGHQSVEDLDDIQALQWAVEDVIERAAPEYLR